MTSSIARLPNPTFACLWCGQSWTVRAPDDLEGFAKLCPDCLGKAGDNEFLRFRLRAALEARAAATATAGSAPANAPAAALHRPEPAATATAHASAAEVERPRPEPVAGSPRPEPVAGSPRPEPVAAVQPEPVAVPSGAPAGRPSDPDLIAYYEARAPEYDDWYLRRGRYEHGPIHDAAWNAELDAAGRWLDGLPLSGRLIELAAGTGWWSPLLASKGELWMYDAAPAPLVRARERLVAHRLRAHLHVRDAWAEPEPPPADGLFAGFWLSHVERDRTAAFLDLAARWLAPGGRIALLDSLPDARSGAIDHPPSIGDRSVRRLADGREFDIVKVHRTADEVDAALATAGFVDVQVTVTGRFFLLATARRG